MATKAKKPRRYCASCDKDVDTGEQFTKRDSRKVGAVCVVCDACIDSVCEEQANT